MAQVRGLVELRWPERTVQAGSGTRYEVASEALTRLRIAGRAQAPCIADGLPEARFEHDSAERDAYYLVRAVNVCGPVSGDRWGLDSSGRPRPACP